MVNLTADQIAHYIGKPQTTVRTAMKRLEARGRSTSLRAASTWSRARPCWTTTASLMT